jgi:hypothetical protein
MDEPFIADFHGPENNQRRRGQIGRFPEDLAPPVR